MNKAAVLNRSFVQPPCRLSERRTGIERRVFSYSHCIPEQRIGMERRRIEDPATRSTGVLDAPDLGSPEFD